MRDRCLDGGGRSGRGFGGLDDGSQRETKTKKLLLKVGRSGFGVHQVIKHKDHPGLGTGEDQVLIAITAGRTRLEGAHHDEGGFKNGPQRVVEAET